MAFLTDVTGLWDSEHSIFGGVSDKTYADEISLRAAYQLFF